MRSPFSCTTTTATLTYRRVICRVTKRGAAWITLPVVLLCGCYQRPNHTHEQWDAPQEVPRPVGVVSSVDNVASPDGPKPEDCGRGTGRNDDGTCVSLETWDVDDGQRVLIPAGEFAMGSGFVEAFDLESQRNGPAVERSGTPPHYEDVAAFWLDLTEVSRRSYQQCVIAGACDEALCDGQPPGDGPLEFPDDEQDTLPQTCVSHEQARAYCGFRGARLPTEAEWEYAASGPPSWTYPWGDHFRDDVPGGIMPARRITRMDASYFGILGMASSAEEWVDADYEPDAALLAYGPAFRERTGPLAKARGAEAGHVVKHVEVGKRKESTGPSEKVGFRCAADLRDGDPLLRAPAEAKAFDVSRVESGFEIFAGVAESVNRTEAETFCEGLVVPGMRDDPSGWRLPTSDEVITISASFRGPGPFWTQRGAVVQQEPSDPESLWTVLEVSNDEPLGARCVRSLE